MLFLGSFGEKGIFASLLSFFSLQLPRRFEGNKLVATGPVPVPNATQKRGAQNAEEAEEKLGEDPGESLVLASLPLFPLSAIRNQAKSKK